MYHLEVKSSNTRIKKIKYNTLLEIAVTPSKPKSN